MSDAELDSDCPPPWELPPVTLYADEPQATRTNGRAVGHGTHVEDERVTTQAPIDWAALDGKEPPQRVWWVKDWLGPTPTLFAGGGGKGKSSTAQTLATALVTPRDYIAPIATPLRVLIWSCEDDHDEIWRRQVAICHHFGIEFSDLDNRLVIVPRIGLDNTLYALAFGQPAFTPLLGELYQQLGDYRADVLMLDNIAQVFGANSNDQHQVTRFVNGVKGLVRDRPFAPVFLGHTARSEGSEFMGSAAWENACRMRWYLGSTLPDVQRDADDACDSDVVYLAKRKANYSDKDYVRLRFRDGLFVPDTPDGQSFMAGFRDQGIENLVLAGLRKLGQAGIRATDAPNSPDYLPRQLVAKGMHEGSAKKELTQAMNRLVKAGRLRRDVVGQYSNRADRLGLVEVTP